MQLHPGKKIQMELKDRGWTQRQFAFLLGKKVSEVNELIKGKRNITVQWDILLSHVLGTSRKYWLDLQNEYEYSLIESDFDISKLPNIDQKISSPDKTIHQTSEQQNESEIILEKINQTPQNIISQQKKEEKPASQANHNLNKAHKIDKDVDISKQQEKHPKLDGLKSTKIDQNGSKLEKINKEGQEKKDKNDRQKIYNQNDKFDSHFPPKAKKEKHGLTVAEIDQHGKNKKSQEKKDDNKDHHKHKENIFRNF